MKSALVISLDFELHWGLVDRFDGKSKEAEKLVRVWEVVPKLLNAFDDFGIRATWATVGFLFAENNDQLSEATPHSKPEYADRTLDSYQVPVGQSHLDDPIHFCQPLIERIRNHPEQEIASHTFAHYFCLEDGQTAEAFRADLAAANQLAATKGIRLESIVFPRNQHNADYDSLLVDAGIRCFRGNPDTWLFRNMKSDHKQKFKRFFRLLDAYFPYSRPHDFSWESVRYSQDQMNVPGSVFLRPYSNRRKFLHGLHVARIKHSMTAAARRGRLFHLWWHPHNFAENMDENFATLVSILEHFVVLKKKFGMESLSMRDVAGLAVNEV